MEVFRFASYVFSIPGQGRINEAGFIPAPPDSYHDAQTSLDAASR
jgi:hypothetical protein